MPNPLDLTHGLAASTVFEQVFGLPLHPLAVHAPVVLLPLTALIAIALAVVPRWSVRFGGLTALIALVAAGSAFLAKESGEALQEALKYGDQDHFELGDTLPLFGVGLFVAVTALWWLDRSVPGQRGRGVGTKTVAVVTVIAAVLVLVWTVRVGHSGAELVWDGRLPAR